MNRLPDIGQVSALRLGDHPGFDAWFYSFCAENNIEHGINPSGVASPEQLRFMVAMDERQVYAPCSDATFRELAASFHLRSFPPACAASISRHGAPSSGSSATKRTARSAAT